MANWMFALDEPNDSGIVASITRCDGPPDAPIERFAFPAIGADEGAAEAIAAWLKRRDEHAVVLIALGLSAWRLILQQAGVKVVAISDRSIAKLTR